MKIKDKVSYTLIEMCWRLTRKTVISQEPLNRFSIRLDKHEEYDETKWLSKNQTKQRHFDGQQCDFHTEEDLSTREGGCRCCKEAKLQAGIKPTALCSVIDKENSIKSPLDSATLYIQLLLWLCTLPPTVLMLVS